MEGVTGGGERENKEKERERENNNRKSDSPVTPYCCISLISGHAGRMPASRVPRNKDAGLSCFKNPTNGAILGNSNR